MHDITPKATLDFSLTASGVFVLCSLFGVSLTTNSLKQGKYKKCPFNKGEDWSLHTSHKGFQSVACVWFLWHKENTSICTLLGWDTSQSQCYLYPGIKKTTAESITKLETFKRRSRRGERLTNLICSNWQAPGSLSKDTFYDC